MKKFTASIALMTIFLVGITTAKSGDSASEYQGNNVRNGCKQNGGGKTSTTASDWAIFVTCLTGIIYSGVVTIPSAGFLNRAKNTDNCSS